MKRDYPFIVCVVAAWLLIIALCVLLTVKARAQIAPGALHRLIGNPSLTGGLPVTATYWWNFADLTVNTRVTNWVDRNLGSTFVNLKGDNTVPTNTSDGVYFRKASTQYLTNSGAVFKETNQSCSHWVVVKRTGNNVYGNILDSDLASTSMSVGYYNDNKMYIFQTPSYIYGPITPTNTWTDLLWVYHYPSNMIYFYTNGVIASGNSGYGQACRTTWRVMCGPEGQGMNLEGYIKEVAVFSNKWVTTSEAMQLHTYATNKYGY